MGRGIRNPWGPSSRIAPRDGRDSRGPGCSSGSTDLPSELGPQIADSLCSVTLGTQGRAHRHSYLPWEGWTAACPRHLALVQLPGDLGYVLARRGGGLDVIYSRHVDHRRARRRGYIYSQKMAGFPESLSKDSAPALLPPCTLPRGPGRVLFSASFSPRVCQLLDIPTTAFHCSPPDLYKRFHSKKRQES